MDNLILYFIFIGVGVLLIASSIIIGIVVSKKEKKKIPTKAAPKKEDESHPNIIIKDEDYNLYKQFMAEYGDEDFKFVNLQFRKGAKITGSFGISEGYRTYNGNMEWGYVRIHTGVDRAGGGSEHFDWSETPIRDIVKSPFNFEKSHYIHYGNKSYGTLVLLYNLLFGFEMRVAHIHPTDFIPWSLKQFQSGNKFGKNWVIGSAGNYGASSGAHTHTEFKSLDEACEPFEILLEEKYGDKVHKEYTSSEVVREYRKYKHFKNASERTILKDWEETKKTRKAFFVNKYLYRYIDWDNKPKTRYSSELLFNGL